MSTTKTESAKDKIKFHEKTFEVFGKEGLDAPHDVLAQKERFDKFMSKVKTKPRFRKLFKQ